MCNNGVGPRVLWLGARGVGVGGLHARKGGLHAWPQAYLSLGHGQAAQQMGPPDQSLTRHLHATSQMGERRPHAGSHSAFGGISMHADGSAACAEPPQRCACSSMLADAMRCRPRFAHMHIGFQQGRDVREAVVLIPRGRHAKGRQGAVRLFAQRRQTACQ